MNSVLSFLVRALLIAAGLVFAASLLVVMLVLMVIWVIRLLWAKLTGQTVSPFVMRMNPRQGFEQVFKRAPEQAPAPRRELGDVTDVEPKVK
jgi:flagellar biosynthesis protein FlhB